MWPSQHWAIQPVVWDRIHVEFPDLGVSKELDEFLNDERSAKTWHDISAALPS